MTAAGTLEQYWMAFFRTWLPRDVELCFSAGASLPSDPEREQRMNEESGPEEPVSSFRCPELAELVGFYKEDFGDLLHSGRELRLHDDEKFDYTVFRDLVFQQSSGRWRVVARASDCFVQLTTSEEFTEVGPDEVAALILDLAGLLRIEGSGAALQLRGAPFLSKGTVMHRVGQPPEAPPHP